MPDETTPPSLEVLAEKVRSRLAAHGQHGALAEFGAYVAAVDERLKPAAEVVADEAPAPAAEPEPAKAPRAKKAKAAK